MEQDVWTFEICPGPASSNVPSSIYYPKFEDWDYYPGRELFINAQCKKMRAGDCTFKVGLMSYYCALVARDFEFVCLDGLDRDARAIVDRAKAFLDAGATTMDAAVEAKTFAQQLRTQRAEAEAVMALDSPSD